MCPRITDTDFFTNYHKKQPYYKDQNKTNVLSLHNRVDSWSGGTWLPADQSSSSTLTESSFLFDPCLIHRDTVMLE